MNGFVRHIIINEWQRAERYKAELIAAKKQISELKRKL
jgi:hypothetical protein